MAARKSSRVNPKYKTRYRVQNWPEYETRPEGPRRRQHLVQRRGGRLSLVKTSSARRSLTSGPFLARLIAMLDIASAPQSCGRMRRRASNAL